MSTNVLSPTEAVFGKHVQSLISRDLDAIMSDYSDDAVVFTPNGAFKGPENIRLFFTGALNMLPPEATNNIAVIKQDVDGEFLYVLWSALPAISFAGDTFCIRSGKIVLQSFVTQMG